MKLMHLGLAVALLGMAAFAIPSAANTLDPPAFTIDVHDTMTPDVTLCDPADQALFALSCVGDMPMLDVAMLEPVTYDPAIKRTDRRIPRTPTVGGFVDEANWFDFDGLASAPMPKPPK